MSDTYYNFTPINSLFVPKESSLNPTVEYIQEVIKPQEIEIIVSVKPQFFISGEIDHIIVCPECQSRTFTSDFFDIIGNASSKEGYDLDVVSPCCQSDISLKNLIFTFPEDDNDEICDTAGFAGFCIQCLYPEQIVTLENLEKISKLLDCETRVIFVYV